MDMSKYNDGIKNASDEVFDDGPRFPDGNYIMAAIAHEEKPKGEQDANGVYPQMGLWVTFRICEGEYKGKDFSTYYGLKHPTSKPCVRNGMSGLKKLYMAINFMPIDFSGAYGKRFVATLKSKKQPDNQDFPWSTEIKIYSKAPEPQGQTFNDTMDQAAQSMGGTIADGKAVVDDIPF